MVVCAKCDKNLRFFQLKFDYNDENGNPIKYCYNCNQEYEKEIEEERLIVINEILKNYLGKCNSSKKIAINTIYTDKEIYSKIKKEDLQEIKMYFVDFRLKVKNLIKSSNYENLDEDLLVIENCEISFEFIEELEKILKLIRKKNLNSDYFELIKILYDLVQLDMENEIEDILKPEFIRIKNKIGDNISVENILREFMKSPLDISVDLEFSISMLDKFGFKIENEELTNILNNLEEEIELEYFEENLQSKKKFFIEDYEKLDGYQFESFLIKIFEAMGYIAINTKLSNDYGADLILMKDGEKTVVQAKKYAGSVSNKAIQEVVAARNHYKCQNMLVVTTGEFTKGAIELSLTNKVELWDKKKLDHIIDEINNNSNFDFSNNSQKTHITKDNSIPAECPYCCSKFEIVVDNIIYENGKGKIECPECGFDLDISLSENESICQGCGEKFEKFEDLVKHYNICDKLSKKKFNCEFCESEFLLDEEEYQELKNLKTIETECPECKKYNIIKE